MRTSAISFFSPSAMHAACRADILAAMARVYDSNWYILGPEVEQFEQEYSQFGKVAHTVGVGNGLEALVLSLRALGIGPNDEVLVPSNTYIATWLAVSHVGATPVPVEPELATNNLDPNLLVAAITARTRAIMPVHLYGQACRMPEILTIAEQHSLWVVEDNAQSQGATFDGHLTGSFGHINATSFYPTKNLGALGDAGAVTTADATLARSVRQLGNYGATTRNQHKIIGYNSRLDELQAALLRVKLPYLTRWTAERQQIAGWYNQYLADIPGLRLPQVAAGATHVYHLYVVHTARRNELRAYLAEQHIETLVHYPVPPHQQPAYAAQHLAIGALPVAEELAITCLSLPMWPGLVEEQIQRIATAIRLFFI